MRVCKCGENNQLNFYKDKNCKYGLRSMCKACDISRRMKFAKENPDKTLKVKQTYYCKHLDKIKKYATEKRKAGYFAEKQKEWYGRNKRKHYANIVKRRVNKKLATLVGFDDELRWFYMNCPNGYEVHHIMPLTAHSDKFCGLHVPWNLEYVTKEEHLQKHMELREIYG